MYVCTDLNLTESAAGSAMPKFETDDISSADHHALNGEGFGI